MTRIIANDAVEIRRFINDLRQALKNARRGGGGYSSFLRNNQGETILQVEIALSVRSLVR